MFTYSSPQFPTKVYYVILYKKSEYAHSSPSTPVLTWKYCEFKGLFLSFYASPYPSLLMYPPSTLKPPPTAKDIHLQTVCFVLKFALWWSLHSRCNSGKHPSILTPSPKYVYRQHLQLWLNHPSILTSCAKYVDLQHLQLWLFVLTFLSLVLSFAI